MKVEATKLPGVLLIEPDVYGDNRGFFQETWQQQRYAKYGLPESFVQDNLSFSRKGVLRGLHFQNPKGQGKLISVLSGQVFDVAVDIRNGSPTFGQWIGVELSSENHRQLWIPAGFAHGFCVVSEEVLFSYKCDAFYAPEAEGGICWNDPDIGIRWPLKDVELSAKDQTYSCLKAIDLQQLPIYDARVDYKEFNVL